ncbi:MAG: Tol-Pal system beta propeller repeat protein TolB [Pontibacterium sp.]
MKSVLVVAAMVLGLFTQMARAELTIEITEGIDKPTAIAVVPFSWAGGFGLEAEPAAVIGNDLARSGLFAVMNPANMLSTPSSSQNVSYRDWRLGGQEYVLVGQARPRGADAVEIDYELLDVYGESVIYSGKVASSRQGIRDAAHSIADIVYEQLTGLRGAFRTRLLYVSVNKQVDGSRQYNLFYSDSDGERATSILSSKEPILSPSWSKDARRIAYVSFENERPQIFIHDLATGQRQRLASFPGLNGAPAWSPDGTKLALVLSKDGNPEIYIFDMVARSLTRMTHHYGIDTEPAWAADGQSIIFTSDRGGQPQIYRLSFQSRQIERLTFEGNYNARASLTDDGRFLAMVHRGADNEFRIAVQDLKTGRLDILTRTMLDESPTISPNGSMILYATQVGERGVLAGVTLDGGIKFLLPSTSGDVREPAWSPYLQ